MKYYITIYTLVFKEKLIIIDISTRISESRTTGEKPAPLSIISPKRAGLAAVLRTLIME
jgi:hypothetical protein